MNLFDLTGKVAIVTGSSRGIGRAIAEAFADAGAKVVISSRNQEPCDEVAAAIRAKGGEAIAVTARISDKAQLENLVAKTREQWGGDRHPGVQRGDQPALRPARRPDRPGLRAHDDQQRLEQSVAVEAGRRPT